jgi:hypothetical protein
MFAGFDDAASDSDDTSGSGEDEGEGVASEWRDVAAFLCACQLPRPWRC